MSFDFRKMTKVTLGDIQNRIRREKRDGWESRLTDRKTVRRLFK